MDKRFTPKAKFPPGQPLDLKKVLLDLLETTMSMALLQVRCVGVEDEVAARHRITREVEEIIRRRGPHYRDLELEREELLDELDDPYLDELYDNCRPSSKAELLADLCGDLGLTTVPLPRPKRSAEIIPLHPRRAASPKKKS